MDKSRLGAAFLLLVSVGRTPVYGWWMNELRERMNNRGTRVGIRLRIREGNYRDVRKSEWRVDKYVCRCITMKIVPKLLHWFNWHESANSRIIYTGFIARASTDARHVPAGKAFYSPKYTSISKLHFDCAMACTRGTCVTFKLQKFNLPAHSTNASTIEENRKNNIPREEALDRAICSTVHRTPLLSFFPSRRIYPVSREERRRLDLPSFVRIRDFPPSSARLTQRREVSR